MSEDRTNLGDRQMRLRYNGRCRLCGTPLLAGESAIYEPASRTVRCIECAPPVASSPNPSSAGPSIPVTDALRLRAPASAVISEAVRVQATVAPRSAAARLFGRSPLTTESRPWYLGALGELEVARVLDELGDGWAAIHAIPVGAAGSDIDHLVIGPGGVFTINSKFHEATKVWVGSKRLLVNGQRTEHLRNAGFEASRVAKILTRAARRRVDVTPIVAIVAARSITIKERPTGVEVLSSTQLARWLQRRPVVLARAQVSELQRIAADPATWGSPQLQDPDLVGFTALRESVAAARRRRILWASLILLSPIAIFLASLLGLLH